MHLQTLLEYNGFAVVLTRKRGFVQGPHHTVRHSPCRAAVPLPTRPEPTSFYPCMSMPAEAAGARSSLPGGRAERLAGILLYYLIQEARWPNRGVKTNRAFYVLVQTAMPAVLTENGFIDNPGNAAKL